MLSIYTHTRLPRAWKRDCTTYFYILCYLYILIQDFPGLEREIALHTSIFYAIYIYSYKTFQGLKERLHYILLYFMLSIYTHTRLPRAWKRDCTTYFYILCYLYILIQDFPGLEREIALHTSIFYAIYIYSYKTSQGLKERLHYILPSWLKPKWCFI